MSAPLQHISLLCLCTWYLLYYAGQVVVHVLQISILAASRTFLLSGKLLMLAIDWICFEPSQVITRQATPVTSSNWMRQSNTTSSAHRNAAAAVVVVVVVVCSSQYMVTDQHWVTGLQIKHSTLLSWEGYFPLPLITLCICFMVLSVCVSPVWFFFTFSFLSLALPIFFLSIRSLSTRIVPLRFQAGGHRKQPNLGLVYFVLSVFLSLDIFWCFVLFGLV